MKKIGCLLTLLLCTTLVASQAARTPRGQRRPAPKKAAAPAADVASQDWTTPAEIAKYRSTPRYDETMAYFRRMAAAAPQQVRMEKFGATGEGRDLYIVIASKDGVFDPVKIHRANRPVVLIQNAIHAGEMDGKDASMALLREMVITGSLAGLLDKAVVVIIPIYNADGHERFGPYNRINQNGPEEMGWRTQGQNLNLNRDYLKADAPETRSFLRLWNRWLPDFFIDDHVTDGADYQYDTTYNVNTGADVFPDHADWIKSVMVPYIEKSVTESGHVIGAYVGVGEANPTTGLVMGQDLPRFSTGYALIQNRMGFLVEQHMLKDYRTRVTGNYELLRALLEVINRDAERLVKANREADAAAAAVGASGEVPLRLRASEKKTDFLFHGYKAIRTKSEISGGERVEYTQEKMDYTIPLRDDIQVTLAVKAPAAYIVPRPWQSVIGVLSAHGVRMKRLTKEWTGEVETYRCTADWQQRPYEGRHPLAGNAEFGLGSGAGLNCRAVREKMSFPAGSAVVTMDQRTAKVAAHWLEPMGPDSAVNWGHFDAIFEQKEYGEPYVLEPLARRMLENDPALKREFDEKVASDPKFAASPAQRLNFFYQRSPYWDRRLGLYPVGRVMSLEGIPLD